MSDFLLHDDIRSWLMANARGHENAKSRHLLADALRSQGHSLPKSKDGDCRKLRLIYREMPEVGSCLKGIFWIVSEADRRIARGLLMAKAKNEYDQVKVMDKAAPTGQMGLFEEAR
jgi:hypothetical protein